MPLDHSRRAPGYGRAFAPVQPIIDATTPPDAIRQIMRFLERAEAFRVGVPDTSFFPFSAICRLELTFPTGLFAGTGFYVAPDLILTCGHNLFDDEDGWATQVKVQPASGGRRFSIEDFILQPADWSVHPRWQASNASDRDFDLAVLRVPNPPPGGLYFDLINHTPGAGEAIAVCGYSGADMQQKLDIDIIRAVEPAGERVLYNLQTRGGASGSPVFAYYPSHDTGAAAPQAIPVLGVHTTAKDDQHNAGVLLTPEKLDWIAGRGLVSVSQGLSHSLARRGVLGGLPLQRPGRQSVGGLPLTRRSALSRSTSLARGFRADADKRAWIVIDESDRGGMSVARRTFGHPTHDLSGRTTLSVRVPNLPAGGTVEWNVPDATHRKRVVFGVSGGTSHSVTGTSATLLALAGGPAAVDVMVRDASGTVVESNKYWFGVPQFVLVAIHPSTDAYFDGIGMGGQKAAIQAEMRATLRHLYRNVNIRFVFPGDELPLHLGLASDPAFPGGIETLPSVYYSEVIGSERIMDPEESRDTGTPTPYAPGVLGRNHQPGDQAAPLNRHSVARGLIHRFSGAFAEVSDVEARIGRLSPADLDLAARMYGRLMGENAAHEVGHFMGNAFVPHDVNGGFMDRGASRSFAARTGMTANATGPILTDAGRGTINDLSPQLLRIFEEFLPINPPIDQARARTRGGRVGSFSTGGWVNLPVGRTLSEATIHLPGATVLSGWQARAFVAGIETAFRAMLVSSPSLLLLSQFVGVDDILDACDRFGVTLAVGIGGSGALGGGPVGSVGMVFAPGRRIGFFGSGGGAVGWIYSIGASLQLSLFNGGPELMEGDGHAVGVAVETIGWFSAGTLGAPLGAHMLLDGDRHPIGATFEFGVSAGLPVISLIEAYGQASRGTTSFGLALGGTDAAPGMDDARAAALQEALAAGADPAEAEAFVAALFP